MVRRVLYILLCFNLSLGHLNAAGQQELWYGVYLNNNMVGWARTVMIRKRDRIRVESDLGMKLAALGTKVEIASSNYTTIDPKTLYPISFYGEIKGGLQNSSVRGIRDGDKFVIESNNGYTRTEKRFAIDDITLPAAADYLLANEKLERGWKRTFTVFLPELMREVEMSLEVTGEREILVNDKRTDCFKVVTRMGPIEMMSFVGKTDGVAYRVEQPPGITLLLQNEREIKTRFERLDERVELDVISDLTVPADRSIESGSRRVQLLVKGLPVENQVEGPFQMTSDTTAGTIVRIDTRRPYTGRLEVSDGVAFDSTPFLEVIGSEISPDMTLREKTRRLYDWVQENFEKKITFSIPDAKQVLYTKQGDCNELAELYTALCRAAGIPCRSVVGLVGMGDRFFYHAWNEVKIEEGWIPVDNALEQFPADAFHLRLVASSPNELLQLTQAFQNYEIRVLSSEK